MKSTKFGIIQWHVSFLWRLYDTIHTNSNRSWINSGMDGRTWLFNAVIVYLLYYLSATRFHQLHCISDWFLFTKRPVIQNLLLQHLMMIKCSKLGMNADLFLHLELKNPWTLLSSTQDRHNIHTFWLQRHQNYFLVLTCIVCRLLVTTLNQSSPRLKQQFCCIRTPRYFYPAACRRQSSLFMHFHTSDPFIFGVLTVFF